MRVFGDELPVLYTVGSGVLLVKLGSVWQHFLLDYGCGTPRARRPLGSFSLATSLLPVLNLHLKSVVQKFTVSLGQLAIYSSSPYAGIVLMFNWFSPLSQLFSTV